MAPLIGLSLVALLTTAAPAAPAGQAQPFAVVELFTSEGCSSCPPADRLLSEISSEAARTGRNVLALEFHVDYWNGPAWRDSLSAAASTERQQRYAHVLGTELYTPEAIVNGRVACVGSDAGRLRDAIGAALGQHPRTRLSIEIAGEGGRRAVRWQVRDAAPGALLSVALTESGFRTHVGGGENAGRELVHDDVVREFRSRPLGGESSGEALIPVASSSRPRRVVVMVQDPKTLAILDAAALPL